MVPHGAATGNAGHQPCPACLGMPLDRVESVGLLDTELASFVNFVCS